MTGQERIPNQGWTHISKMTEEEAAFERAMRESMTAPERTRVELTREQWLAVKWALIYAGNSRRSQKPDMVGSTLEDADAAYAAIAEQLSAEQEVGE